MMIWSNYVVYDDIIKDDVSHGADVLTDDHSDVRDVFNSASSFTWLSDKYVQ